MKKYLIITGFLLLFAVEILRVYFIMPFPGSQQADTIDVAYFIGRNARWLRLVALLMVAYPLPGIFKTGKRWARVLCVALLGLYGFIFYKFNFVFEADKMFYQPQHKHFAEGATDTTNKDKLIIGVNINNEARAYPIQIIGYHHQVQDTVGNVPVLVTYCTVCRTGRVFSPMVNGKKETFRLVGMDHFNAMLEDATTKSWWQQATGTAIAGPLKGQQLAEIPSQQMRLSAWLSLHPQSKVLQPDTIFNKDYKDLAKYDSGTIKGKLERRDSASWKMKSWVVGVVHGSTAKAYDWNELVKQTIIQDSIGGLPIAMVLEKDGASFHVWSRRLGDKLLSFSYNATVGTLTDVNTNSTWNMAGLAISGPLSGLQLTPVQSYQEFWHSWQHFHPRTGVYPTSKPQSI